MKGANFRNSTLPFLSVQFEFGIPSLLISALAARETSANLNRAFFYIDFHHSACGLLVFTGLANLNLSPCFVDCDQTPTKLIRMSKAFSNPKPLRIRGDFGKCLYDDLPFIARHLVQS